MAMEVELGQAAQKVFTDSDVVHAVLDGDREAFSLLVERYQKGLATYIFHMIHHYEEALELTQEVFIKVYENLNRYDGQYKFSTWLYKIASNHTIDHIRRQHMTTTAHPGDGGGRDLHGDPPGERNPQPPGCVYTIRRSWRMSSGPWTTCPPTTGS